jgi:ABC-type multidrug transport system fused ATPase/permease subunit
VLSNSKTLFIPTDLASDRAYSLDLPQEPPAIIESNRVPAYWPSSARNESLIRVENLTIRYAPELPAVLHDVSFSLKAGERVGLLGRTGSGKSTLAMSILRFVSQLSNSNVVSSDMRRRLILRLVRLSSTGSISRPSVSKIYVQGL